MDIADFIKLLVPRDEKHTQVVVEVAALAYALTLKGLLTPEELIEARSAVEKMIE